MILKVQNVNGRLKKVIVSNSETHTRTPLGPYNYNYIFYACVIRCRSRHRLYACVEGGNFYGGVGSKNIGIFCTWYFSLFHYECVGRK